MRGSWPSWRGIMIAPEDVADAVMYAVTRPAHVHIPEIVIRPNKNFDL